MLPIHRGVADGDYGSAAPGLLGDVGDVVRGGQSIGVDVAHLVGGGKQVVAEGDALHQEGLEQMGVFGMHRKASFKVQAAEQDKRHRILTAVLTINPIL